MELKMKVELLNHMGDDLTVANAARVSFDKHHEKLDDNDYKLIKYLAEHNHWSPFAHCFVQFRISAPIFVARQLQKHQVGLAWNEVSRRYVNYDPEFWSADKGWREATDDKKQGSGRLSNFQPDMYRSLDIVNKTCLNHYRQALDMGICEEQARALLPQSMFTTWIWSGSLYAFSRVCNLRISDDAQQETKEVALGIDNECKMLYPLAWSALRHKYF
jgi:thymidylate synthase (FAD)